MVSRTPQSETQRTVLVVDDEPISRNVFAQSLQPLGYRVLQAVSIIEASAICQDESYQVDVLIADYMLTDGKGTDLAMTIREHCPDVRVLLTSGTPLEAWRDKDKRTLAELGVCADFLPKPFRVADLRSKLARLLSESQFRRK